MAKEKKTKLTPWGFKPRQALLDDPLPAELPMFPVEQLPATPVPPRPAAPPVAPGSGLTLRNSLETQDDQRRQKRTDEAFWVDPEEMLNISGAISRIPAIAAQQSGQDALLNMAIATGEHSPSQLDLTGLADLTNYVTKGQYKSSYKAPEKVSEKLSAFANKLQDNQRDISKTILEGVSKFKAGTTSDMLLRDIRNKIQQENESTDPNKFKKNPPPGQQPDEKGFLRDFRKDAQAAREAYEASNMALTTLMSGSKVGYEAFKNFMARASGEKGPLSKDDLLRFQGSQAIRDRIDRAWDRMASGEMTDADQKDMRLLADAYSEFNAKLYDKRKKTFTGQSSAYKVPEKRAEELLGKDKSVAPPSSAPDFGDMLMEMSRKKKK